MKLIRLWPHARKDGYEVGQTWRIGYYSRQDGLDTVWLERVMHFAGWNADGVAIIQPRVVRHELPWVREKRTNPEGGCITGATHRFNPDGVGGVS